MTKQTLARPVELTDLLCNVDPLDGRRLPVRRDAVLAKLKDTGQRRAARLATGLPTRGEYLDADAVDALLLRVHAELQRLGEELQLPRRVAETLRRWSGPLLAAPSSAPVRVVDVGCGLGHVVRWLAAHDALGPRVELVGVDLNATLVAQAASLAAEEALQCRFITGNAFTPGVAVEDPQRTIIVSSGLLHHIAPDELPGFFAAHEALGVSAFAHFDVDPSRWATVGAWVFHQARMREPISRHDGVLSASRAHPADRLLAAAMSGAPGYQVTCDNGPTWRPALVEVLRPILGARTRA
jgi:SAM-dependent methyltransferase